MSDQNLGQKETFALNFKNLCNLHLRNATSLSLQDSISGWVFSWKSNRKVGCNAQQASCVAVFAFAKEGK